MSDIKCYGHLLVFCCDVAFLIVGVNFFLEMVELSCEAGLQLQVTYIFVSATTCCP